MAQRIVKDSKLAIFVAQVQVAAANAAEADVPKINTLFNKGAISGLIGDTPRKGEDGAWYATIDTAAEIRLSAVTVAFTEGQPVYSTAALAIANASATGSFLLGYAKRPKAAASGDLWVQLVPRATGAVA